MSENNTDLNEVFEEEMDDADVITVPIDETLSNSGEAADAAAVGAALALKADKDELPATIKVNNQPADNQGLILIDGTDIPVSDSNTKTLAEAIEEASEMTAATIPMTEETGAATIGETIGVLQETVEGIAGNMSADKIPMSEAENAETIAEAIGIIADDVEELAETVEGMEQKTADKVLMETGSTVTVKDAIETLNRMAVKSVNRKLPDASGDVDLSVVPLAENLQSDKLQSIEGEFTLRTTGGTGSVSDGKAYPQHIYGNSRHDGFVAEVLNMTVIPITRTEPDEPITATIDRDTFLEEVEDSDTINLYYTTEWSEDPADYGVTVTGDPVAGDQITIVYVKEVRGTIVVADPDRLVGTGWNLFNYNAGYARVVKYSETYGYKIGGAYTSIAFSATLTGDRTSLLPNIDGLFNVPGDGYVFVTGGNNTDTYILATWSDWTEGPSTGYWEAYRESGIDLAAVVETYFPYGMLKIGTVRDEIDLVAKRAISRIERMVYSEENRETAEASERAYDFDESNIYIVREEPVISAISIGTEYSVSEHGMEWFTETVLPLDTEILYGKNLREKLERDVLTISKQTLTEEEKAQVRTNIGAMSQAEGDTKLVAPTEAGTAGQLLHLKEDGGTEWTTQGTPTDDQVGTAVSAWLTAHPEATTTVEDGAISRAKLNEDLKEKTDAVPELKSAFDSTLVSVSLSINLKKAEAIDIDTGTKVTGRAKYARTYELPGYPKYTAFNLTNTNYEYRALYYDATGNINDGTGYLDDYTEFTQGLKYIPSKALKIGLVFRRKDNSSITDSDISAILAALSAFSPTDRTMTKDGKAADAKVVNDMNRFSLSGTGAENFLVERIALNGSGVESNNNNRLTTGYFKSTVYPFTVVAASGYNFRVATYNEDMTFSELDETYYSEKTISDPTKWIRLVINKNPDTSIRPDEFTSAISSGLDNAYCILPAIKLRGEIKQNTSLIVDAVNKTYIVTGDKDYYVQNKTIINSADNNHEEIAYSRIVTGFIKSTSYPFTLQAALGYTFKIAWYNDDFTFGELNSTWYSSLQITPTYSTRWIRIIVRKGNDLFIDPSEFGTAITSGLDNVYCVIPSEYLRGNIVDIETKLMNANVNDDMNIQKSLPNKSDMMWSFVNTSFPLCLSYEGVNNKVYWGYTDQNGYSGVASYDIDTGEIVKTHLKRGNVDDHNCTSIYIKNGCIITAYADGHNDSNNMHFRKSTGRESVESFTKDYVYCSDNTTTYNQFIEYDGNIYDFFRNGNKNWHCIVSTDDGLTWGNEKKIILSTGQYYCKLKETTTSGLLRLVLQENSENENFSVRMGFLDLTTGKIYNADNSTELGTWDNGVSYDNFTQIFVPTVTGGCSDIAITAPSETSILITERTNNPFEGKYRWYHNGTIYDICDTGESHWHPKYKGGICFFGTDKVVLSRSWSGSDYIEIWNLSSSPSLYKMIYSEAKGDMPIRNIRPITDQNQKVIIWLRGYYNRNSYQKFKTDAKIYLVDENRIV